MTRAAVLAVIALALLPACTEDAAAPADAGERAAGEVLGGTISDAMIPLDQLDSQAPLAPRQGPSATEVDAEQPEVTPGDGVGAAAPGEAAEAAPAAPAPEPSQ
jgi:hypothetical protein